MTEVCSQCDVVETGPFCPVHGAVHRPFVISERYQVDSLLVATAGAFVFGALDATTTRQVAIKVLRSDKVESWRSAALPERPPVRDSQRAFQRGSVTLAELPRQHATDILNVGRDDALGITYVVIDRNDLPHVVWPDDALVDAAVTASITASTETGVPRQSATLDALERMTLPDMIGSYRVLRQLGAGASGRVFLAEHSVIGSKVAIKVLLPDLARQPEVVTRFLQEARASSQIGSPNIPRFYDFGTTMSGQPYAVMEYFEGETLGHRLQRGTMSVAETAEIIDQAAAALQMAHDAGLIHRDLKPENLFLVTPATVPGRLRSAHTASMTAQPGVAAVEVKLLDFGIAKAVGRRSAAQTQTGAFLGTPFYCAPEQVFGGEVDARTDVYSLGSTAYEMLIGTPPFTGEVPEILSAKTLEEPPDPRQHGLPEVVAETLQMMLARDPRLRAPSMAWVRSQVARWTRPGGAASVPPPDDVVPARTRDPRGRLGRADTEVSIDEAADEAADAEALGMSGPVPTLNAPEGPPGPAADLELPRRSRRAAVLAGLGAVAVLGAVVVALGLSLRKPEAAPMPVPVPMPMLSAAPAVPAPAAPVVIEPVPASASSAPEGSVDLPGAAPRPPVAPASRKPRGPASAAHHLSSDRDPPTQTVREPDRTPRPKPGVKPSEQPAIIVDPFVGGGH